MSQTIVWLEDKDGDTFPIALPGIFESNRAADYEAALQILREEPDAHPRGAVTLRGIEYAR